MNFFAPAKINLFLYVHNRREDGYHEISTLMVPVSLFDRVTLSKKGRGIEVFCHGMADVPDGRENIAYRAAEGFFDTFSVTGGVRIDIEKSIPAGAGLGGGSSDAAAVLKGMSILFLGALYADRIISLASRIGSDVPFFVYPFASRVSGKGDVVKKIEFQKRFHVLIVKPGVSVSSGHAYEELRRNGEPMRFVPEFPECVMYEDDIGEYVHNDFEDVVFRMHPEVRVLKERLISLGADSALMSGSGSSVFGLFERKEGAQRAREDFSKQEGIFTTLAHNF